MTPTDLTLAFKNGYQAAKAGRGLSARFDEKNKKARTFWEAGFHKASAELKAAHEALIKTPEYIAKKAAEAERDLEWTREMFQAINAITRHDYDEAHRHMNRAVGFKE